MNPAPEARAVGASPERRQATIAFCDVVDSTALASRLDPEDLREVLGAFFSTAGAIVSRHEGLVARYMGDGMLLYFGYPHASEDAPERAARAALEIVEAVARLEPMPGIGIRVRVGVATGMVVIGDVLGEGAAREQAVSGITAHLAARVQAVAQPGQVLVADSTRLLLGNLFDCQDLGLHPMKGFSEPQRVWHVAAEQHVVSRFKAQRQRHGSAPLVGRDAEAATLQDLWAKAAAGSGQIVEIRGEAGIGKSRLAEAFLQQIENEPQWLLRYSCTPHTANTALFPVISQIEFAAGFARQDAPVVKLQKLADFLERLPTAVDTAQAVSYLGTLLSIPLEGSAYPVPADTPERRRDKTLEILRNWPLALSKDRPVVMFVEDLHWADPTTLDLLGQFIAALPGHRVLLIATSRPEFESGWSESPRLTRLPLNRLDRDSRVTIVNHFAADRSMPDEVLAQIVDRSDGVPLFVEEITHAVLEGGALDSAQGRTQVIVPSSLQDLLMARLDRLSGAKEIAQVAAVIGRDFSRDLLAAVVQPGSVEIDDAIARLDDAELVQPISDADGGSYRFRHALIQDAAYGTLLRATRQRLHGRIAEAIEARFPETAESAPELLAHHFTQAADAPHAVPYWRRAGLRAASRAANAEASRHFEAALTQLALLPITPERLGLELELQVQLGLALSAWRGYAAPGVETAYRRARELCHMMGDVAELFPVIRGLCTFYIVRTDLTAAHELALQCVRLGEETARPDYLVEGYSALGYVLYYFGQLDKAVELLSRSIEIYRNADGEKLVYPSAQDPCIASLCLLSHAQCLQGRLPEARRTADEAIELAQRLNRPFEMAYARGYCAMLENLLGNPLLALNHAQQCLAISQERGFMIWLGVGTIQLCCAMTATGNAQGAVDMLEGTFAAWLAGGAKLSTPFCKAWIARTRLALGHAVEAAAAIDEGLAASAESRERYMDADLLRLKADVALTRGERGAAAEALRESLRIAAEQGTRLFELRSATALYRLEPDAAAREYLERVLRPLAGYTEICPDMAIAAAELAGEHIA